MKCDRAIIQYVGGKPAAYSLVIKDLDKPEKPPIGSTYRTASFKEAYETFPAIKKHWNADGTAKD